MRGRAGCRYEMDMCSGPLLKKVLQFALPLMATGILQLLYNAADIIVVGRFAGKTALAAVSSTGSLINLIVNLFMGLSVDASVVVARRYGAGDYAGVNKVLHTAVTLSIVSGILVGIVGFSLSRTLLEMMDSPEDVIDQATLYLRIYFVGIPAAMVYNYCAASLRALGDTKRPLYYLSISGAVNVILNLILVIFFRMGVAGVAIATAVSQVVSMVLIVICLLRTDGCIHLDPKKLRIDLPELKEVLKIGLPAGLQSSVFAISNVLIQSSINSFGSAVMAANGAAGNIEGFIYTAMNSISQATLTFTGQNMGAKKYNRILRILGACSVLVTAIGLIAGVAARLGGPVLLQLYTTEPEVVAIGLVRLSFVGLPYFLCGLMEVAGGMLRGCGYSVTPMIVSMLGACAFRVIWIYTLFAAFPTLTMLYISYPISWLLTTAAHMVCFWFVWKKMPKVSSGEMAEKA